MDTTLDEIKTPGERLAAFLKANGTAQEAFALRIGIKQGSLSKICRGIIRPSLDTATAIEVETDGAVPATSWAVLPIEQRGAA